MLNLRVQEVHSNEAFLVEDEGVVDDDAPFLALCWARDDWTIDGLTSPIRESEEAGESMVTVFITEGVVVARSECGGRVGRGGSRGEGEGEQLEARAEARGCGDGSEAGDW